MSNDPKTAPNNIFDAGPALRRSGTVRHDEQGWDANWPPMGPHPVQEMLFMAAESLRMLGSFSIAAHYGPSTLTVI